MSLDHISITNNVRRRCCYNKGYYELNMSSIKKARKLSWIDYNLHLIIGTITKFFSSLTFYLQFSVKIYSINRTSPVMDAIESLHAQNGYALTKLFYRIRCLSFSSSTIGLRSFCKYISFGLNPALIFELLIKKSSWNKKISTTLFLLRNFRR